MELNDTNFVKKLFGEGKRATAAWAQAGSNITTEILGEAGFDVVLIDMEHGPGDIPTLVAQIQSLKGLPAVPFVRAPWNDFVAIKRILDAGAFGLLVPYVNTADEAKAAVRAVPIIVASLRCAPTIGRMPCNRARDSARISAKWPISGITGRALLGTVLQAQRLVLHMLGE